MNVRQAIDTRRAIILIIFSIIIWIIISFFIIFIAYEFPSFIPPRSYESLRYLLSAESQALAAIMAIVFAIIVLGTQVSYQLYSPKYGYKFISGTFLLFFGFYSIAVVFDLSALWLIPNIVKEVDNQYYVLLIGAISIFLTVMCIIILPIFIESTMRMLVPKNVFDDVINSIRKKSDIDEVLEFLFLSIISALNRNDYVAMEDGINSILKILERKEKIEDIIMTLDNIYEKTREYRFTEERFRKLLQSFFDKNLDKEYIQIFYEREHYKNWLTSAGKDTLCRIIIDFGSIDDKTEFADEIYEYSLKTNYKISDVIRIIIDKKIKEHSKYNRSPGVPLKQCIIEFRKAVERGKNDIEWTLKEFPQRWDVFLLSLYPLFKDPTYHTILKNELGDFVLGTFFEWGKQIKFTEFQKQLKEIYSNYFGNLDSR